MLSKSRSVLEVEANGLELRSLFRELCYYVENILKNVLSKYCLESQCDVEVLIAFVNSRYCTVSRLLQGYDAVVERILQDKLTESSKLRLLRIVENARARFTERALARLRDRVMKSLKSAIPTIVVDYEGYNCSVDIWQQRGFMLADGGLNGVIGISNDLQFETALKTFGKLILKFKTFYIEASTCDIVIEFDAYVADSKLHRSLVKWRRWFLGGGFREFYCLGYGEWVRFFAGLFDGDGFVKVKHRYAVDVGVSCGGDVKGCAVREVLRLGEARGLYVLGRYDERSCKQYLRLCGGTLRFLKDVVVFLNHPERRFKLERFLVHRCC